MENLTFEAKLKAIKELLVSTLGDDLSNDLIAEVGVEVNANSNNSDTIELDGSYCVIPSANENIVGEVLMDLELDSSLNIINSVERNEAETAQQDLRPKEIRIDKKVINWFI